MQGLKIISKGLSREEVDELLHKALHKHSSGDIHFEESFDDPVMEDMSKIVLDLHKSIYDEMISEIIEALEDEYR